VSAQDDVGTLTLNGSIVADGGSGTNPSNYTNGGGSGGGCVFSVVAVGHGTISAKAGEPCRRGGGEGLRSTR